MNLEKENKILKKHNDSLEKQIENLQSINMKLMNML